MENFTEIEFLDIEENNTYAELIKRVVEKCFEVEKLLKSKLYISITLTTPNNIRRINKEYRQIDKETDVLSFPMFEKNEIEHFRKEEALFEEALGDIIISIERVKEQAEDYGHSFERELAYMVVHGFYHLMGEDHIEEEDRVQMREKEEKVLKLLDITRE
ncbi:MAG: rRNA maturation RNase YbeY [Clostridia bacterium]|nr:rRNA maturation RNase YbeY [Clostridia bacterium]